VADVVESFFRELNERGHDPLLDRLRGTGRFELVDGDRVDVWLVTVKGGYPSVSRGEGEADWMVRADRATFVSVITGDTAALAAVMRGTFDLSLRDTSHRLGLLPRVLAGPTELRRAPR
jgi:putative sterol carrier protein